MARITRTFTIERELEDVYDAIADFSQADEWDPGVASAAHVDGPRVGQGAQFELKLDMPGGLKLDFVYVTTTAERPNLVVHETDSVVAHGVDRVSLAAVDGGTEVTWDAQFTFKGPGRLVDGAVQKGFEKVGDKAVDGLEEWLAAGGTGHAPVE